MNDPPLKGWPRLRDLVRSVSFPLIGAEVGVSMGWTSEQLLREFPTLSLFMVDFWSDSPAESAYTKSGDSMAKLSQEVQNNKMVYAEARTAFAASRRRLIKSDSVAAANGLSDGYLAFAFIDGDHTYEGVKRDLEAWAPKVRSGGLLIMHDFRHPRDKRGLWGVERACREFFGSRWWELHGDEKSTICWCEVKA